MLYKSILPLIIVTGVAGFAQHTPPAPKNEQLNQPESAQPASATASLSKGDAGKTSEGPTQQKIMEKRRGNSSLGDVATTVPDNHVVPATVLSNDQLLAQAKTIYVVSHSFFVKKEQLERGLIQRKELNGWGFHVVQDEKQADLVLRVRRAPFQNNFPFTFTDRVSGIVVMGGTVNSLFGTVPGKIAGRLADRLKEAYKKAGNH